jgi:type VI secretion system protein ImpF
VARNDQIILTPSILDRLLDDEPDRSVEPEWARAQGVFELRDNVKRDLESLLNCRQTRPDLVDNEDELAVSMLTFGLPDFTSIGGSGGDDQETLRRAVERTVERFEPRLKHVDVSVTPAKTSYERSLHLTISAMLWIDPEPIPISFDTIVQTATGTCEVKTS